jgi:hypothetical protein
MILLSKVKNPAEVLEKMAQSNDIRFKG